MYALKQPKPNYPPQKTTRVRSKARSRTQHSPYRAVAYETTAKLTVNIVLSVAAITALFQLLPYRSSQEVKVQELEAAVNTTNERVKGVQGRFSNFFDPYQARENMQDLTDRIDPLRRRVIWTNPSAKTPVKPAAQPDAEMAQPGR